MTGSWSVIQLRRKSKDFTYNYVDRIRLAESSLQDHHQHHHHHHYPVRASGWRHKSVSHLDLATSCHSTASGLSHWPAQRNLRPSRSLDYNHINRCKDALDIAEYYWRIDPEEHYEEQQQLGGVGQKSGSHLRTQYKDALYRDYADETYHSTNSIYTPTASQQQQSASLTSQQQQQQQQQQILPFDVGNDTCSLRRSRSLAVIREETFSDLQITSTNSGRRRSQLIPRARLVNRGFFREHEARFNCANNKHHHHQQAQQQQQQQQQHHSSREKLTSTAEQDALGGGSGAVTSDPQQQSQQSSSHHHHHHHHQQQQKQQHSANHHQSREADDYYENLKRLDAAAAAIEEHLHPWHNDKSDLESLNSDYFKNSLHQSGEVKQQHHQHHQQHLAQQQQQLEKEIAELTTLQRSDKPRIYQSRRKQRTLIEQQPSSAVRQNAKLSPVNGVDSCPENSQSSLFPETTTSNSDDQTDSLSLSEQEYDLTKIEEIFHNTLKAADDDEDSYELISLTTTTRTHIETTEGEEEEGEKHHEQTSIPRRELHEQPTTTDTEAEGTLKRSRALSENLEKLIAYDSVYLSSEDSSESTLIDDPNEQYRKVVAAAAATQQEQETRTTTTLLHISIEDTVFDSPLHSCGEHQLQEEDIARETANTENSEVLHVLHSEKSKIAIFEEAAKLPSQSDPPIYTQILKVEHSVPANPTVTASTNNPLSASSAATKPRILAVVEKRKLKRAADSLHNLHELQRGGSNDKLPSQSNSNLPYEHFTANLVDNQYHSLPDVNIGKSLKVSECIDAKLRSSYNLNKYQEKEEVTGNDCRVSALAAATCGDTCGEVTTEEIYDSIKRFGQAHQKARLLSEYQELEEEKIWVKTRSSSGELTDIKQRLVEGALKEPCKTVKYAQEIQYIEKKKEKPNEISVNGAVEIKEIIVEANKQFDQTKSTFTEDIKEDKNGKDKDDKKFQSNKDNTSNVKEKIVIEDIVVKAKLVSEPVINEKEVRRKTSIASNDVENTSPVTAAATEQRRDLNDLQEQHPDSNDFQEQPKEAPSIEVIPHFTREIERRAKEIKQIAAESRAKRQQERDEDTKHRLLWAKEEHHEIERQTFTTATFRINKSTNNFPQVKDANKTNSVENFATTTANTSSTTATTTTTTTNPFRIIVTDTQNNIIEEDSIEGQREESFLKQTPARQLESSDLQATKKRGEFDKEAEVSKTKASEGTEISEGRVFSGGLEINENSEVNESHKQIEKTSNSSTTTTTSKTTTKTTTHNSLTNITLTKHREKSTILSHNRITNASLKRVPSKPKRQQLNSSQQVKQKEDKSDSNINLLPFGLKSKDRRVLGTQIYKARPVKVLPANESFRRAAIVTNTKMSRPQILHIVDNKRNNVELGSEGVSGGGGGGVGGGGATAIINSPTHNEGNQVENEFMKKVDAARCYWSKLAKHEQELETEKLPPQNQHHQPTEHQHQKHHQQPQHNQHSQQPHQYQQPQQPPVNQINFQLGAQQHNALPAKNSNDSSPTLIRPNPTEDFCSFMPSIEIVELDGEKKATIVSTVSPNDVADTLSNSAREPQFDHIRYKVMKSQQLLRSSSNILARNKKEAQFDGLIQYLQDYSFQELLSNNNVVIVEPVRTKIERPMKTNAVQTSLLASTPSSPATITNGSTATTTTTTTTEAVNHAENYKSHSGETMTNGIAATGHKQHNAIKRHFFYQPVRVNRELYEEELPNPDTVRNVRKFFEEHILPTPGRGIVVRHSDSASSTTNENQVEAIAECPQLSPRARRARKYRYLTIDTSYGHAHEHNQQAARKWDSASLSSGISSGDLSSPCDCNEADACSSARASAQSNEDKDVNRSQELKGVHVQDYIRQHNMNTDKTDSGIKQKSTKWTNRPRPRSAIVYAENSYYREVYEQNIRQASEGSKNRRRRIHHANNARYEHGHNASGNNNNAEDDNDDDDDDAGDNNENDDVEEEDEDDEDVYDDDELSESYYVSNDVLEKIRECGSSVTYYGGRVLQNTTSDPHNHSGGINGNYNNSPNGPALLSQHSNSTLTRVRVREFETCSVCQPNECPHSQQLKDKFQQRQLQSHSQSSAARAPEFKRNDAKEAASTNSSDSNNHDNNGDAYSGVKFKLIKSNSCSSRLELAGAEEQQIGRNKEADEADDDATKQLDDCEVVRDIVKRLEASSSQQNMERKLDGTKAPPKKLLIKNVEKLHTTPVHNDHASSSSSSDLTINNQLTPSKQQCVADAKDSACEDFTQVTVNNHINVRHPAVSLMQSNTKEVAVAASSTTSSKPTPKIRQEKESHRVNGAEGATKKDTEIQLEQTTFQSSAMNIRLDAATTQGMMGRDKQGHHSNNNGGGGSSSSRSSSSRSSSSCSSSNNNGSANVANNNNTTKICRNKNVDLAFTMTKQQQQQHPSPASPLTMGTIKNIRKSNSQLFQPTLQSTQELKQSSEQVVKNISKEVNNNNNREEQSSITGVATVVPPSPTASNSLGVIKTFTTTPTKTAANNHLSTNKNNNNNNNYTNNTDSSHVTTTYNHTNNTDSSHVTTTYSNTTTAKSSDVDVVTTLRSDKPKSIIVPVEIHQHNNSTITNNNNNNHNNGNFNGRSKDTIQLSTKANDDKSSVQSGGGSSITTINTSTSTTSLDKTFVRHYVANDKRLLERRKYDDIEFEEFEVYDPAKDVERLTAANTEDGNQRREQLGVKDLSSTKVE